MFFSHKLYGVTILFITVKLNQEIMILTMIAVSCLITNKPVISPILLQFPIRKYREYMISNLPSNLRYYPNLLK